MGKRVSCFSFCNQEKLKNLIRNKSKRHPSAIESHTGRRWEPREISTVIFCCCCCCSSFVCCFTWSFPHWKRLWLGFARGNRRRRRRPPSPSHVTRSVWTYKEGIHAKHKCSDWKTIIIRKRKRNQFETTIEYQSNLTFALFCSFFLILQINL